MGRKRREVDTTVYSGRLAERVRQLREAKGLSVEELADRVGFATMTVYQWESGYRQINPDCYPALAKALGCKTVPELFPPR